MRFIPYVLIILLATSTVVAIVTRPDDLRFKPAKNDTMLAQRINSACPKGYFFYDLEVRGQFTNIPPGVVKVSCISKDPNRRPAMVYKAVAR